MSADLKEAREQMRVLERDNTALRSEVAALKASLLKAADAADAEAAEAEACHRQLQVSAQQGAKVCRKL